jgi:hypothetical protein
VVCHGIPPRGRKATEHATAGAAATRADPSAHNLTTGALAALFGTSQYAVDRIIRHLVPVLAKALRPTTEHWQILRQCHRRSNAINYSL